MCRHPLDRCICWANLDGFSVWILNQNHIFPPLTCCESPSCLPCLLPQPAIIHWQSCDGRKHRFGFLSSPHVEPGWWMVARYTCVYEHLISDALGRVVLFYHCHLPNFPLTNYIAITFLYLSVFVHSILFSVFKVILSSHTPHSPQSISAALFHFFVLSTALLPDWQLSEVGSILIYFTWLWIFSVNSSFYAWLSNLMCAY